MEKLSQADIDFVTRMEKYKTPRQCTKLEMEKRADMFRAIGQDIAADLLEVEILKGRS